MARRSERQMKVLRLAERSIGGHVSLMNKYNRMAASALHRAKLGRYWRGEWGAEFTINAAGKRVLKEQSHG